jgi:hypothetical protein
MRLIKLIVPAAAFAAIALFAPHAEAQTMGEYATTTASAADGAGGLGSSIGSVVNSVNSDTSGDIGGGSRTWGASSLGGSFEDRAGSASSGGASFDSRAGSMTGGSDPESRFPSNSRLDGGDRFSDSSGRFSDSDRFGQSRFQDQDRFPSSAFNDNRMGLDTNYNSK